MASNDPAEDLDVFAKIFTFGALEALWMATSTEIIAPFVMLAF